MSEDLIGAIQQLLILGKGDQGRLEYLLESLQKGRPLPDSDHNYLKMMIPIYLGSQEPDLYKKNVEDALEKMQEKIHQLEKAGTKKGFEKYVGRKAVLFFVTIFVGWNALQSYVQPLLSSYVNSSVIQYVFPLDLAAGYLNYGHVVWLGFIVLVISWPFIGAIHLAKFIASRKMP